MGKKFKGGYIGILTESEKQALAELHEKFAHWKSKVDSWGGWFKLDDRILLKFLRARDFDMATTCEMLEKNLVFREKWQPHLLTETDADVKAGLDTDIWRLAGETREGHPIQLVFASRFNAKTVVSLEQYTKFMIYQREATARKMDREGWKVETTSVMFDMAGFSLFVQGTPFALSVARVLVDLTQNQYPEMLQNAIIFNAPVFFKAVWAIVRPWLDHATAERVIFVNDPARLHSLIDPSVLHERYGGTRKDEYLVLPDTVE